MASTALRALPTVSRMRVGTQLLTLSTSAVRLVMNSPAWYFWKACRSLR